MKVQLYYTHFEEEDNLRGLCYEDGEIFINFDLSLKMRTIVIYHEFVHLTFRILFHRNIRRLNGLFDFVWKFIDDRAYVKRKIQIKSFKGLAFKCITAYDHMGES